MTAQFLTDKHNLLKQTAPARNVNSLIHPQDVPGISAAMFTSGTRIVQPGRLPGQFLYSTEYSAEMRPSGSTTATGYTNYFFGALVDTPSAHLMAYPGEAVSTFFGSSAWIRSAYSS